MQESAKQELRLDRRLIGRRGFARQADLERELAALPDVSAKAELIDAPDAGKRRAETSPQGS